MEKINISTGEISQGSPVSSEEILYEIVPIEQKSENSPDKAHLIIRRGGLYAPLPIPAYKMLGAMKEYRAQRILMCLVSHMGYTQKAVFPSYNQLVALSGVRKNDINNSLKLLCELGFLKISKIPGPTGFFNKYYVQESAYKTHLIEGEGRKYSQIRGFCTRCGKALVSGEFFRVEEKARHYKCGGSVFVARKTHKWFESEKEAMA